MQIHRLRNHALHLIATVAIGTLSMSSALANNTPQVAEQDATAAQPGVLPTKPSVADMLLTAMSLTGVRYKFGGNTPDHGFDCSGFVRHLFATTLSINLPRSSYEMGKRGVRIAKDALQAGDLVFYNTRKRAFSHVGIYIGEGRFIHAPSKGKSVETVDMTDSYWVKRFNGARRIVETISEAAQPPPTLVTELPTKENAAPN